VVSSRPRKHVGGSVITAVSLATFPGTVPRNEPTVHHRLQDWVGSSATTAQDGATWPEIVRQSRVVDLAVSEEVDWRGRYRGGPRSDGQNGGVRVNLVSTGGTTQVKTREMGVQYGDGGEQANPISTNSWEFGDHPIVGTVCAYDASFDLCAYPLKYDNVTVSGYDCVALEDSGCQIPLVSNRLFSELCKKTVGNVTLHGLRRGQTVHAPLANVTVCLGDVDCENVRELPIMCAVIDFCS